MLVPFLTIVLGIDIHYAIGASLISVIATSSGSAIAQFKGGLANIRLGMFLEIAAIAGALFGTFITTLIAPKWVAVIFGVVLLHSSYMTITKREKIALNKKSDPLASYLRLNSEYVSNDQVCKYYLHAVPGGFLVMFIAGILSGLLGIGSGALKVIGMDHMMKLPFKVSTATSNFMIGITAATSAGIYLNRGYINPELVMPVMLGVLCGSVIGTKFLKKAKTNLIRWIFAVTICILGFEMIYNGIAGKL